MRIPLNRRSSLAIAGSLKSRSTTVGSGLRIGQFRLLTTTTPPNNDAAVVKRLAQSSEIIKSGGVETTPHRSYDLGEENHFGIRHIGPREHDQKEMLKFIGCESLDDLTRKVIPPQIMLKKRLDELDLPRPIHEHGMLEELRKIAKINLVFKSYIGMGYYNCITPSVIVRQMLENAGWITQYTPYQAEIAQGRLESLMNFQTMVSDLTGLDIANASLLDEATACGEAMTLCHRATRNRNVFLVDENLHPQNIAVIQARAEPLGIDVRVGLLEDMRIDDKVCGVIVQYPNTFGTVNDLSQWNLVERTHHVGALFVMCADLLSLTMIRSPGEWGADIAVGSAQRFGVPIGYGGPHAAYMSVSNKDGKNRLARMMPGRIVGTTKDQLGVGGYRLALQTREQHIRRDKATSNICTAQALLANMAAMYGVYHGPGGLKKIADKIHRCGLTLCAMLHKYSDRIVIENEHSFFDTLKIKVPNLITVHERAIEAEINMRYYEDGTVGVSLDETVCVPELTTLVRVLVGGYFGNWAPCPVTEEEVAETLKTIKDPYTTGTHKLSRTTKYMEHPVFNSHHSEAQLVRYMKRLENKDLSLVHSMIPLGSCTMKLNASSELMPITWPAFNAIHPFAPRNQTRGYNILLDQLERWLCEITGYDRISFQPNSGAQGEYAGLLAIRSYFRSIDQPHRTVCMIPTSAHGTNPASARLAGFDIVVVANEPTGETNLKDLKAKIEKHKNNVGAIMITYPSTFGVFDENIVEVIDMIHDAGGQVYLDGANMNAQVCLTRPGDYGSDVSHLNLHKTFCIPHGGGGPGMGPIGVKKHLAPFLPSHPLVHLTGCTGAPVSGAPFSSASILPIAWAYIRMMGASGLKQASQVAILNANYCMKRLETSYRTEYRGRNGYVAHEFIVDCRNFKKKANITVNDIAKRMMDYGFHAPTMSWPIHDCLMMEPTESEARQELDRFCDVMISIRDEIGEIQRGEADPKDNVLVNSPHTLAYVTTNEWNHSYTREKAVYPKSWCHNKHWPAVGRLDNEFGDRNLVCTCPPVDAYVPEQGNIPEEDRKKAEASQISYWSSLND